MKSSLKICLLTRDFFWGGGIEFLRNISNSLAVDDYDRHVELFLLLPVRESNRAIKDVIKTALEKPPAIFSRNPSIFKTVEPLYKPTVLDFFSNTDSDVEIVTYLEHDLLKTLKRIEADVVLPVYSSLGSDYPIPWVGYIFDFQHKYFPEFFSLEDRMNRDLLFSRMVCDAKAVIVNSQAVKHDVYRFFPEHNAVVYDLPFSASPFDSWFLEPSENVAVKYGLPQKYFLISNQFWIHKAHDTAFVALANLLNEYDVDVHMVCTGEMADYRFPDHIERLRKMISDLMIGNNVHFLGHIPKQDQINIMKNCVAVLQPTLFEGGPGGGSVFDAISLGVPAIVSNIEVNKEIQEENVFFFEARSPGDLALKMLDVLNTEIIRPGKNCLVKQGLLRRKAMAKRIFEAISFAMIGSANLK